MYEPRNFASKRLRARRLIADRGLTLQELPNGHFRISGKGIDVRMTDLVYLQPQDLYASNLSQGNTL